MVFVCMYVYVCMYSCILGGGILQQLKKVPESVFYFLEFRKRY